MLPILTVGASLKKVEWTFVYRRLKVWVQISSASLVQGNASMKITSAATTAAIAAAFVFASNTGFAQQNTGFDGAKFWREMETRNVKMPENFDGQKFLDELATRNVSNKETFDAQKFFAELEARGVKVPANFDAQKFFDDLSTRNVKAPPIVDVKK